MKDKFENFRNSLKIIEQHEEKRKNESGKNESGKNDLSFNEVMKKWNDMIKDNKENKKMKLSMKEIEQSQEYDPEEFFRYIDNYCFNKSKKTEEQDIEKE